YRAEGSPEAAGLENPFPDVSAGQYYTDAVIWAAEHKIVLGYASGGFGPDDNITREQMAAILYRYEQYAEKAPADTQESRAFADGGSIGDYAKEAVAKLVTQGIIAGKPNNRFDPRGSATRAEFAAVLHRFTEAVKEDAADVA
ncbi:MAG: S-layer homology domain-containing protein, partial [Oscillospiraceae bacterium]|nr:S-layer homology domain-containing protein [Oscillospiraceae bacterium]